MISWPASSWMVLWTVYRTWAWLSLSKVKVRKRDRTGRSLSAGELKRNWEVVLCYVAFTTNELFFPADLCSDLLRIREDELTSWCGRMWLSRLNLNWVASGLAVFRYNTICSSVTPLCLFLFLTHVEICYSRWRAHKSNILSFAYLSLQSGREFCSSFTDLEPLKPLKIPLFDLKNMQAFFFSFVSDILLHPRSLTC